MLTGMIKQTGVIAGVMFLRREMIRSESTESHLSSFFNRNESRVFENRHSKAGELIVER